MDTVNIFWFRRDLRIDDNAGLYQALKSGKPVIPLFIFDRYILDKLDNKSDRRVSFIHEAVLKIQEKFANMGSTMEVHYGYPAKVFNSLLEKYRIAEVFTNDDYEPYAIARDKEIKELLQSKNVLFKVYKDHVIFEKNEVVKEDERPYTVFTPYSKKWLSIFTDADVKPYSSELLLDGLFKQSPRNIPSLKDIGFNDTVNDFPSPDPDQELISKYNVHRDYPGQNGTSRIGVHLRFGTVSIRKMAGIARLKNETYLKELIWREFYQCVLWHFPHVANHQAFKPEYDKIEWRNDEDEFQKWCAGQTGYPIVDAGMRELNATGFMHNRVRMVVASFLIKHLLIDWRWGEAYFATHLLDFDFASNNGGWQWAAGSGCDAAPYFRIFNPYLQTKKFDKDLIYIKKWVPEFLESSYPKPIIEHEVARKRVLEVFGKALRNK